jgi:hypothetical protein
MEPNSMQVLATIYTPQSNNANGIQVRSPDTSLVDIANARDPGLADSVVLDVVYLVNGVETVCQQLQQQPEQQQPEQQQPEQQYQ